MRATVTIPEDLEQELKAYLARQDQAPSLASLMQVALRRYLAEQEIRSRQVNQPRRPFKITPAAKGSGLSNISIEHDRYLADEP